MTPPPPAPIPPFVPTVGPWTVKHSAGLGSHLWSFTMGANGAVASIKGLSNISVTCTGAVIDLNPDEAAFDTPFTITTPDVTATDHFSRIATGGATSDALSTFTLHFDSAGHATGTFRLTGSLVGEQGALDATTVYAGCDTGPLTIELQPGVFT